LRVSIRKDDRLLVYRYQDPIINIFIMGFCCISNTPFREHERDNRGPVTRVTA